VTASFAFGSADLYAWLNRNQDVRMLRTETVNDPARIARPSVREELRLAGRDLGLRV
jgi:acyl-CoA hydrolase